MNKVDLIIIGAGPGGYVAAIRAAQLGMTVLCVEKRGTLGGTCLNVGCIPSKALLYFSHKYTEALHHLTDYGVEVGKVSLNLNKMMENKDKVVTQLTKGIEFLFQKNKITRLIGTASLRSSNEVSIKTDNGEENWPDDGENKKNNHHQIARAEQQNRHRQNSVIRKTLQNIKNWQGNKRSPSAIE